MARPAHPKAMAPSRPGPTRTAPPQMPASWWSAPRIRTYLLFDATGIVYLLLGFVALEVVWALGVGPDAWDAMLGAPAVDGEPATRGLLAHPLMIAFHLLGLCSVIFVGVRFFSFFPKAQPPRIGPVKPPPAPVILGGLYAAWIGLTLIFATILAGGIF
jgi:fumarate reductase subunit C